MVVSQLRAALSRITRSQSLVFRRRRVLLRLLLRGGLPRLPLRPHQGAGAQGRREAPLPPVPRQARRRTRLPREHTRRPLRRRRQVRRQGPKDPLLQRGEDHGPARYRGTELHDLMCGLTISEIAGTNLYSTRPFTMNPEHLKETVQRVEELGMDRGALVAIIDKEVIASRMRLLHNLGFSKDDVLMPVRKHPRLLGLSEQKVQGNVDLLMKDVGLEVSYIV